MAVAVVDLLAWFLMALFVVAAPFSKVEESFNTQATHDFLLHGAALDKFDHQEFPGVVPRTFLGAGVLATVSWPLVSLLRFLAAPRVVLQVAVRLALGTWTVYCMSVFRRAAGRRLGRGGAWWMMALTCTQFHLLFYASRLLPNVMALGMVLQGLAAWIAAPPAGDRAALAEYLRSPSTAAPPTPPNRLERWLEEAVPPTPGVREVRFSPGLVRESSEGWGHGGLPRAAPRPAIGGGSNTATVGNSSDLVTPLPDAGLPSEDSDASTGSQGRAGSGTGRGELSVSTDATVLRRRRAQLDRTLARQDSNRSVGQSPKPRKALLPRLDTSVGEGGLPDTVDGWLWWGASPPLWAACAWMTAATVWFRCDILVLLAPVLGTMLLTRQVTFPALVLIGAVAGAGSLVVTVVVDSIMWGRLVWPEGVVFFFNALQGGSVAWGTSPWHWYATSALPRSLLAAAPLALGGVVTWTGVTGAAPRIHPAAVFVVPGMLFVALYSWLPHKELRFLFPGLMLWNLGAGYASFGLWHCGRGGAGCCGDQPGLDEELTDTKDHHSIMRAPLRPGAGSLQLLVRVGLVGLLALQTMASGALLLVGSGNYPGGHALQALHARHDTVWAEKGGASQHSLPLPALVANPGTGSAPHIDSWGGALYTALALPTAPSPHWPYELFSFWRPVEEVWGDISGPVLAADPATPRRPIRVHLCPLTTSTGASRFGQRGWPWAYSKNETAALMGAPPAEWASKFDYVVTESPLALTGEEGGATPLFVVTDVVLGVDLSGWNARSFIAALAKVKDVLEAMRQGSGVVDALLALRGVASKPKLWVLANTATLPHDV